MPAGACQVQGQSFDEQRWCYGNGVSVISEAEKRDGGDPYPPVVTTVRKPGGALCYTVQTVWGSAREFGFHTWRDASGAKVAEGMFSSSFGHRFNVNCTDPMMGAVSSRTCQLGDTLGITGAPCTQGACP